MAMDNTPQQSIDPTGGCTVGEDCPPEFDWMGKGTWVADDVNIGGGSEVQWGSASISGGGLLDFSKGSVPMWENIFANDFTKSFPESYISRPGKLYQFENWLGKSSNSNLEAQGKFLLNATYGTLNDVYSFSNIMLKGRKNASTLGGHSMQEGDALMSMFSTFDILAGGIFTSGGKLLKTMNVNEFRKYVILNYDRHITKSSRKQMLKNHNTNVILGKQQLKEVDTGQKLFDLIEQETE